MKNKQNLLFGISTAAFYIGSAFFFCDSNAAAGAMAATAGTLFLTSLILNIKNR